jgi:hypothetical protein
MAKTRNVMASTVGISKSSFFAIYSFIAALLCHCVDRGAPV